MAISCSAAAASNGGADDQLLMRQSAKVGLTQPPKAVLHAHTLILHPFVPEQARSTMQQLSQAPSGSGAWKWAHRKAMWDYMEAEDIARWVVVSACGFCGDWRCFCNKVCSRVSGKSGWYER